MAIAWTELTQGSDSTNNPASTASVSPTSGAVVYCAVVVAVEGGGTTNDTQTVGVSGAGLTWGEVGHVHYGARRSVYVFRGTGTPSSGALSLSFSSGVGTFTEFMWSVDQATGVDGADPDDAAVTSVTAGATALSLPDVGTPGTNDHIYAAFGNEGSAVSAAVPDGTALTNLGGGSDCRTLVAFYDADHSDETPGITWTGTNSCGGVGFIVNAAAGGTAYEIDADSGTVTVTGTAANLLFGRRVSADAGSFVISGTAASLEKGFQVAADSGAVTISGTAAAFTRTYVVDAQGGAFSITGTSATTAYGRLFTADAGTVVITGTDAGLTHGQAGEFVLTAVAGAFSITGTAADLRTTRVLTADAGSVVITGTAATLNQGRTLTADAGALAVTGTDVGLLYGRVMALDAGSYVISGQAAALSWSGETITISQVALRGSYVPTIAFTGSYVASIALTGSVK